MLCMMFYAVLIVALSCARVRLSDRRRVRPSVCLSHAGVDSKLTAIGSCEFYLSASRHVSDSYIYSDKGGGTCFCACLFVCLSVCLSISKVTQKRMHGFR